MKVFNTSTFIISCSILTEFRLNSMTSPAWGATYTSNVTKCMLSG